MPSESKPKPTRKPRTPRAKKPEALPTEEIDRREGWEPPAVVEIPFAEAAPIVVAKTRPHGRGRAADYHEPRGDLEGIDIAEFFSLVSPECMSPRHFAPILECARKIAAGESLRVIFSAPRQHGKSTTIHHVLAWLHMLKPWLAIQYATYEQTFSEHNARNIRRIEVEAGVRLSREHNTVKGWTVDHDVSDRGHGSFMATSIDGRGNGYRADLLVVDDPFKGIEDGLSARGRDIVYETFRHVFLPCLAPGASVIIVASRWHEEDLSGRLIAEGWTHICLPAICDSEDDLLGRPIGEPLCPWGPDPRAPRTLEFLDDLQYGKPGIDGVRRGGMGPHAWSALMQGKPIPPDAAMFHKPRSYAGGMPAFVGEVIGVDLAYSTGSHSDFAAFVHLCLGSDGVAYVTDVYRGKLSPGDFIPKLKEWRGRYPMAKMFSYMSGPERGFLYALHQEGIPLLPIPARYSKLVRAGKTSMAWNDGKVRTPADAPWLDAFVKEVCAFTGSNDSHDDQVDALVSGYDMLVGSAPTAPVGNFGPRWSY